MLNGLAGFMVGAAFNLLVALVIVRFIYYPSTQNKNYVFTFVAFSAIIYFVMGLLTSTDLSVGVGFGLFAIFSVLRYRTDPVPIRRDDLSVYHHRAAGDELGADGRGRACQAGRGQRRHRPAALSAGAGLGFSLRGQQAHYL